MRIEQKIIDAIEIILEERISRLKFNYMVVGLITEVIDVDTYKVNIFDNIETLHSMNGHQYQVGDIVYIVVWNNNYSDKTIVCKATR